MRIVGARPGEEFQFTAKPTNKASGTFVAVVGDEMRVTNYAHELFGLPDETPVLAHWHGSYRTDGFAMTVGSLKAAAARAGHR